MQEYNQGRNQDFRKGGGTLKITINSNYKTLSVPANVTGKAIYNDFCHTVSGTVMLGYAKATAPAKPLTRSQSVTERSVRRHRRLIHSTTTHFFQKGEYYVYFF